MESGSYEYGVFAEFWEMISWISIFRHFALAVRSIYESDGVMVYILSLKISSLCLLSHDECQKSF